MKGVAGMQPHWNANNEIMVYDYIIIILCNYDTIISHEEGRPCLLSVALQYQEAKLTPIFAIQV